MKFGAVRLEEAQGAILAHGQMLGEVRLPKGHVLTAENIVAARRAGLSALTVARPETGDIGEDEAAAMIAEALASDHVELAPVLHGRANIIASCDGLLRFDLMALESLNLVDEAITAATMAAMTPVRRGEIVATVKIIPFAVAGDMVRRARAHARGIRLAVAGYAPLEADLIHTRLPGISNKIVRKTTAVMRNRIERLGGSLSDELECAHEKAALTAVLKRPTRAAVTLVAGASATVDREDAVPGAIIAAGGRIDRLGMPVDPGNLLCLGHIGEHIVIGLPGCARSPKRNGIDLILERLFAGHSLDNAAIAAMGSGGLLADTGERPEPRSHRPGAARARAGCIVLAAGSSTRMGENKLVADLAGKPVVGHIVDHITEAGFPPPIVVTGKDGDAVKAALGSRTVEFVPAPDAGEGIARSVAAGIAAVPDDWTAAIICLGDMPMISSALLVRMASLATEGAIVVPRHDGRRGNPVLWGRRYFARLRTLTGDVGAKALFAEYDDRITHLDWAGDEVRFDLDLPDELKLARRRLRQPAADEGSSR